MDCVRHLGAAVIRIKRGVIFIEGLNQQLSSRSSRSLRLPPFHERSRGSCRLHLMADPFVPAAVYSTDLIALEKQLGPFQLL